MLPSARARRRTSGRPRNADGAAAVEFALVAPLLILLVFGIISYGYLLSFRQAMSQGAAEGARAGAVWASAYAPTQDADRLEAARDGVDEALSSFGVGCGSGATCQIRMEPCGSGTCLVVTVTYPYAQRPLTPDVPLVPMPDTLTYTATTRVQ